MESAIEHIKEACGPLSTSLSPNVANVQLYLNLFEDRGKKDIKLATKGILNYNLCMNAETEQPHTECDSSFTIICVPNQVMNKETNNPKNIGSFEFIINPEETIVVPMEIGTIISYSVFLLTHCQQIRNRDSKMKPFINLVSYNSKRLFKNMMASFRRHLDVV